MHEIVMPASGMAMAEATLLRWLKQPGDAVVEGEPVAEIETDKATADLEAPGAGIMGEQLAEDGDTVLVGAVLATIAEPGDAPRASRNGDAGPAEARAADVPATVVVASDPDLAPAAAEASSRASDVARADEPLPLTTRPTVPVVAAPVRNGVPEWVEPRRPRRRGERFERVGAGLEAPAENDELLGLDATGIEPAALRDWLRRMLLIRAFEEAAERVSLAGKIPGGMHSAAGQEAVAVGAVSALTPTDVVTSSHRSHHHSLAKGLKPDAIMAELYGKADGCLGGRGGHMHLADFSAGLFGSNGIVGGGLGIATGAALGARMRDLDQVAVGFFGDGGSNTGRVWESINLAAVWSLPLIAICENNLYAVETHLARSTAGGSIADRAAGFGLHAVEVDGQDVAAVHRVVAEARERAVGGGGPTFVEARTYRYSGHNAGEAEPYRTKDEVGLWRRTRDPILRAARALEQAEALTAGELDELQAEATTIVEAAIAFADASPWPDPATAGDGVFSLEIPMESNV